MFIVYYTRGHLRCIDAVFRVLQFKSNFQQKYFVLKNNTFSTETTSALLTF